MAIINKFLTNSEGKFLINSEGKFLVKSIDTTFVPFLVDANIGTFICANGAEIEVQSDWPIGNLGDDYITATFMFNSDDHDLYLVYEGPVFEGGKHKGDFILTKQDAFIYFEFGAPNLLVEKEAKFKLYNFDWYDESDGFVGDGSESLLTYFEQHPELLLGTFTWVTSTSGYGREWKRLD